MTKEQPKISALVPWFGSKRSMADLIVQQLGPHRCYWEIFCGSMAVLLAKPECSQETVNDLHGDLINLALVIQHEEWGPWLFRQLRRTLVHEEMHRVSKAQVGDPVTWLPLRTDPFCLEKKDARRAYWFFYAAWMGRNGTIGTKQYNNNFCVRYTTNGGIQGTRFAAAVDSIPAWRRRLREVTILHRDGFELLEKIEDAPGLAVYVDPPYISKGAEYVHDFSLADHQRLAHLLRRFHAARIVVSYYDSEDVRSLYPRPQWTHHKVFQTKSLVSQGQRGKKGGATVAPEVLILNGEAFGGGGELFG